MAAEKVTIMVLDVDLQCSRCYKKTKKTLCKFPQIRDQIYDEKANKVTIKVVCCSPEKIRDKLCCRGGKAIKSIEIIEPPNKPKDQPADKKKEDDKPSEKDKPKGSDKPKVVIVEPNKEIGKPKAAENPKSDGKGDKPKSNGGGAPPAENKPKEAQKAEPAKNPVPVVPVKAPEPVPVNGVPSVFPYVGPSYDCYGAGPYFHGYGYGYPPPPQQPQPCYESYYGHDGYNGYGPCGYGRAANVNRCDMFSEENPQSCSIM